MLQQETALFFEQWTSINRDYQSIFSSEDRPTATAKYAAQTGHPRLEEFVASEKMTDFVNADVEAESGEDIKRTTTRTDATRSTLAHIAATSRAAACTADENPTRLFIIHRQGVARACVHDLTLCDRH